MHPIRGASLLVFMILVYLASSTDLIAQSKKEVDRPRQEKMPDLSGEWLSDSPLDSFVNDESRQPVNKFRIEKSEEADFQARYLGSRATGVKLNWSKEDRQFQGTIENGGFEVTFVVTPTEDPDVLNCKILADHLINTDNYFHNDKWKRVRGQPPQLKAVKSPELLPAKSKEIQPSGAEQKTSEELNQSTVLQYEESPGLTPQIKSETEKLLDSYFEYLKKLGFELQKGQVVLRLQQGMGNAHYYHTNRSIVMDSRVVGDQTTLRREYNHHALAVALGADSREIFEKCAGIESGLADYLGCSQCDDPEVGRVFVKALYAEQTNQTYLRTMDNLRGFDEVTNSSGRHDIGEVLSGALWEMRGTIGKDILDPLLYKAWTGIVKSDDSRGQVVRFASSLMDVAQNKNPEAGKKIREIFERRGLKLE